MYEQSARWNALYSEIDPARRRRMLEELVLCEADDGANEYRMRLFNARHGERKGDKETLDRFLFQFVNLVQVYRSSRMFKKSARREVQKLLREFLWNEAPAYGEAGERALYWELRNAAMRYFKTCESPGYNRALFGLVARGEDSRQERILREVWQMTRGLAERTGLEEEMKVWCCAVIDAYCQFDVNGMERIMAYQN